MKNLLVIEDDFLTRATLTKIFNKDFIVTTCESSDEFFSKFFGLDFDIIIVDISLPGGKNGLAITKEIKNDPKYSNTPILCFTAYSSLIDRQNALAAGVDLYLTKPASKQTLIEAVQMLLMKNVT